MTATEPEGILTPNQVVLAKRIVDGVTAGVLVDHPDIRDEDVLGNLVSEGLHNLPTAQRSLVLLYRFVVTSARWESPARKALEKGLDLEREVTLRQIIATRWPSPVERAKRAERARGR